MTFYVGQKVVCVDASECDWIKGRLGYVDGAIYTVTKVWVYAPTDEPALYLAELPNEGPEWDGHHGPRFRPLVEDRKTVSFTAGAPKDSEKWDNRKKDVSAPQRVRINT